jgi:lipase
MSGAGREPVVFVHGLYQGLGHLTDVPFASPRPMHVIDLPGYGSLVGTETPRTLRAYADHVASELTRLDATPAIVVGHSIGGAVAMLLAEHHPEHVAALVNVEGNFTLADAFWSSKLAEMTSEEAEATLEGFRQDPDTWLARQRIGATPQRVDWTRRMFAAQPAGSIQALARAVMVATTAHDYLPTLYGVVDSGLPVHLIAGERSRAGWAVPEDFVRRSASLTIQPRVGHMMPLEDPAGFLALVALRAG